ncbi:MAG TPA: amino acid permease [Acidobacteriota bacterium]|nr:amino acid permease [Acidobacteriota bacterium]
MKDHRLGLFSGMGMVIANMVGAGVFLSTGFMAQELTPQQILIAWVVGGIMALAGARSYAAIAQIIPHSGGEYRYLSSLVHPALGYLAGWASLLLGFSAPIAIDAVAAGAFMQTLHAGVDPKWFAAALIVIMTAVHAVGLRFSITAQNILVLLKILLVAGFVLIGLIMGQNSWPTWEPPVKSETFPFGPFMQNLFYIAFAFCGWNAAVYAASEFRNARRDVPRAMMLGCSFVGLLYLFANWVFVANLTPEKSAVVFTYESARITLGHLIMKEVVGEFGAACMSVLAIIAFVSAVSAMTFLGPRVYAVMAKDGFLPKALQSESGKPPVGAIILQGGIALFMVFAYGLQEVLQNVGAILTLFSALTVFTLFWIRFKRKEFPKPAFIALVSAFVYLALSGAMLYFGFVRSLTLNLWVGASVIAALIGYHFTRKNSLSRK